MRYSSSATSPLTPPQGGVLETENRVGVEAVAHPCVHQPVEAVHVVVVHRLPVGVNLGVYHPKMDGAAVACFGPFTGLLTEGVDADNIARLQIGARVTPAS